MTNISQKQTAASEFALTNTKTEPMHTENRTAIEKKLANLHTQTLKGTEEIMGKIPAENKEHSEKIEQARLKWQAAWTEFLETLLVLERLEI